MKLRSAIRTFLNKLNIDIIRLQNSPEKTLLGLSTRQIDCILDVGANKGQFAAKILKIFPHAEIYCFEPLKQPFQILQQWASSQNEQVKCFNIGLGDSVGEVKMHFHENHSPSSSFLSSTAYGHDIYPETKVESIEVVRVDTLDNFFVNQNFNFQRNILLKLDVQGFEDRVLRGATDTLAHAHACLLEVCLDPLYDNQARFLDLAEILYKSGFRYAGNMVQAYGSDGHVIYIDSLFVK
jgi:FkbM family methyltransferase